MKKGTNANLLLLFITVLFCTGLCELGTRIFLSDRIVLFPRYHTIAHYGEYTSRRLRPNSEFWHTSRDGSWKFTTNSQGFRASREFDIRKPERTLRIIALGDSHTQGFEVRQDHTFAAVIERVFISRGVKAEVFNTGVSGFGTAEELIYLENEGIKYRPDAIAIGFYANDFEDNVKSGFFRLEGNQLTGESKEFAPGVRILDFINAIPPLRWLSENSYFYSLLMNTVWETAKSALFKSAAERVRTEFALPTEPVDHYRGRLQVRLLERMFSFCQKSGIIMIVLDIPQKSGGPDSMNFVSSIPNDLIPAFRANSDMLLLSEDVLGKFRNLTAFHVPHGQHHINELSHLMLGFAAAEALLVKLSTSRRPI